MIKAEELKSLIELDDLVARLGFTPNRAGFISCPAHLDKTPSLKIYTDDRGWYCFGCNQGGTVIDFYMHVCKVDFKHAMSDLQRLYGLADSEPLPRQARAEIARQRGRRRKQNYLEEKEKEWFDRWSHYKAILDQPHSEWSEELEDACRNIAYAEYQYEYMKGRREELGE